MSHHSSQKSPDDKLRPEGTPKVPSQINARSKIIEILTRVETRQAYTDKLLEQEIDSFNEADRGLVTEVVNGVLRWQYRLDWFLGHLYVGQYDSLIPDVKNNLRSSTYQLIYLDRVPPYAVLNEAVEIAKSRYNQKTANLINAILRNFLRQQKKLEFVEMQLEFIERMCVAYSHPEWLVRRWIEQWGIDDTVAMCEYNNHRPTLSVRVNRMKTNREAIMAELDNHGVAYEVVTDFPEYLRIADFSEFRKVGQLRDGRVVVQDASTAIPVHLLDAQPGDMVLDMCAAPGGKTAYIAQQMQQQGFLMALEKHHNRASILRDNLNRQGAEHVHVVTADATEIPSETRFDKILLDAPCSGLGVLAKRVDLRWKRTLKDIEDMQALQLKLLASAAGAVKPGGTIVYSTCTIETKENEDVVTAFLQAHTNFSADRLVGAVPERYLWENNAVRTFPHRHAMDGSFAVPPAAPQ